MSQYTQTRYSLRHRLLRTILLLEFALAFGISAATLSYWHSQQLRAFDLMLHGRADSLLGAVQDSEDEADDVMVDLQALDLRGEDIWQVVDGSGRNLAHSAQWTNDFRDALLQASPHSFTVRHHRYRGVILHGVRTVDADEGNSGVQRPVTIFYLSPLRPVHEALLRAGQFLVLANAVLLFATAIILAALLRKGLAPLEHLNQAATAVTPARPLFETPQDASQVKELAALATTLESATRRLDQSFRQQQVFVHDAAHELKTDVTIIKSSLQLLTSRSRTTAEYEEGLRLCLADCERMEDLVQRMLELASFEQQRHAQPAVCDLVETAHEIVTQLERFAATRQVQVALDLPVGCRVALGGEACATLLSNLLMNALQHTPAGGMVRITLTPAAQFVTLKVEDTGDGIAPADLPHVFERFYRGDRSRARTTGGSGLGLAICKAIVESCGGSISIESQPGRGATVSATLPLTPATSQTQSRRDLQASPN